MTIWRASWIGRDRALVSIAAAAFLMGASYGHADEDWRKLADLRPAYKGPGVKGRALSVGPNGLISVGTGAEGAGGEGVGGFEAQNVEMLSWVPLGELGSPNNANDCMGYVSPSGREYAILGHSNGTHFIEITDPVNPVIVGYVDGPNSLWRDIEVKGHYAYIVSEAGSGVQVVDLENIDAGTVTHIRDWTSGGYSTTHTIITNPDTPYLYLCGSNVGNGSILVASVEDPENPVIVGRWMEGTARYAHEAQVVTYTEGPLAGHEICYSFFIYGGGVDILDVTDKSNITRLAVAEYPQMRGTHQGYLSADRRYMYINDELDEDQGVTPSLTRVIDLADPGSPSFVTGFASGSTAKDHNCYVRGNLLFESNYRSGLRVYDISDPIEPVQVAFFDSYPENDGPQYNGNWGNFPFFPSGNVILSDMQRGLFVLSVDPNAIQFEFPQPLPDRLDPGAATPITVQVSSIGTPIAPESVMLHVRIGDGAFVGTALTDLGGGLFGGVIPGAPCFADVDFYVTAENTAGTEFASPQGAPAAFYSATVFTGTTLVSEDTVETNTGWTVGDPGNPDNATSGIWNRQDPQATTAQPEDDHTTAGTICWVTDGRAGNGAGDFDVDNGKTTLITPALNLAGIGEARIGYWRWYSNSAGGAPNSDVFTVSVSNTGVAPWTTVEVVGPAGPGTAGGWFYHEFRLADFVAPTANVKLRFVAADEGQGSLIEAAVDDLAVLTRDCEDPCAADWNGDGGLNSDDFFAFLDDFFAGAADYNGDSATNSDDYFAFLNDFFAGC